MRFAWCLQSGLATMPRAAGGRIINWSKPLVMAALAGLRSAGKGANKPADVAAPPYLHGIVAAGPHLSLPGALLGAWRFWASPPGKVRRASPPHGRARCETERNETVTTMSAAEPTRRDFLFVATGAVGAVGAAATLVPLIAQMNPDASTVAGGVPVEVDLAPIAVGQVIKVFWRGKPIYISHLSEEELKKAEAVPLDSLLDQDPEHQMRVQPKHEQWLVVIGLCTHLGCIPLAHQGDFGGWFCPCHGSQYDALARVRKGPAPANLPLPPYTFLSDSKIQIG
jgi:ubiquinol-cytochrome c reductase iron-sulfur subunit